jgi:hypothetical protein
MRPKSFEQFLRAYLVAVGGFLTFSAFYSAQFVLWLVAPVALSDSLALLILTVAMAWATPLFYPVFWSSPHAHLEFRGSVFVVTALRTAIFSIVLIPQQFLAGLVRATRTSLPLRARPRASDSPDR